MRRMWGLWLVALSVRCEATVHPWVPATALDQRDDPAQVRPGYGDEKLHLWWPLTEAERQAVAGLSQAKAGDAHALLALAVTASANHRDAASYAAFEQRVDKFVADVRPSIEGAADDWHRGYELHRAMHRVFFQGEKGELGSYLLDQARITGIFETGRYNCISSAMLFVVVARAFGLPVRGVLVPTHAFVEMDTQGGKVLEVETTSDTGFDWVHDAKFFQEGAERWSASRGLRPVTLDDYTHRQIMEPWRLMVRAMNQARVASTDEDRGRLSELSGALDPDDPELLRRRAVAYLNEANALYEKKASRTLERMFDVLAPAVSELLQKGANDKATVSAAAWLTWYFANALQIVGRDAEAEALTHELMAHVDPAWDGAEKLRGNLLTLLNDRMLVRDNKKDYAGAIAAIAPHIVACASADYCRQNFYNVIDHWFGQKQVASDWRGAREVLHTCITTMPNDTRCTAALRELEAAHGR